MAEKLMKYADAVKKFDPVIGLETHVELSTSWRGENYLFAMNGQTGKFVGDLPVDKGAARKWMLGLTAALSAASYGVMWLLWLARIL